MFTGLFEQKLTASQHVVQLFQLIININVFCSLHPKGTPHADYLYIVLSHAI